MTRTPKQIAADKAAELIEKLERAEGPDREVEWRIAEMFDIPGKWSESALWPPFMKGSPYDRNIPPFTASLDAAVALAERVLPGWRWGVTQGNTPEDDFQGNVWPGVQPYPADLDMFGHHKSATLALCLAILKAVQEPRP